MTLPRPSPPLPDALWQQLQPLLRQLDAAQALWLSGYLHGSATATVPEAGPATPGAAPAILVGYGTETGNCAALADQLCQRLQEQGWAAEAVDLGTLRPRQLARRERLLVICATHGDGDPPEPIHDFYHALMADAAPRVEGLEFSVLSLGDSSYEQYCVTGQQLDARLEELGGQRLAARRDCDVDFADPARQWMDEVLARLPQPVAQTVAPAAVTAVAPTAREYSRQQPLAVEVLDNIRLTAAGRREAIHHLELALEVADFPVRPGDAVGVLADNSPQRVAAVLDAVGLSGETAVTVSGQAMPLVQALRSHCDLTLPGRRLLEFWAELSGGAELAAVLAGEARAQRDFLRSHQVIDLVVGWPARPEAQLLVANLRPLQPRLYDLANSLQRVEDELHLTVKHCRYDFRHRQEVGVASDYLLQLQPGDRLQVYPHRNARFHLPEVADAPLILIGEGAGAAPYRAFLQEITARSLGHRCWLVFAEQRFEEDFLYQLDWLQARAEGVRERVDAVWLADQPGHSLGQAIADQGARWQQWLERGAHLYFCGDKDRMADCERRLQQLAGERALDWKQLQADRRIHRNVY